MVKQRQQRGLALADMLLWSLIIIVAAILGLKLLPGYVEYFEIQTILREIARDSTTKGLGNSEIRERFDKYTLINNIDAVKGTDLKIDRESGRPVITADYSYQTILTGNVYLLIEFTASSSSKEEAPETAGGAAK